MQVSSVASEGQYYMEKYIYFNKRKKKLDIILFKSFKMDLKIIQSLLERVQICKIC